MSNQPNYKNVARLYFSRTSFNRSVVNVGVNFSRIAFDSGRPEFEHAFSYDESNAITGLSVEAHMCADKQYKYTPYGYCLMLDGGANGKVEVLKSAPAMKYGVKVVNAMFKKYEQLGEPHDLLSFLKILFKVANIELVTYENKFSYKTTPSSDFDDYYEHMIEDALNDIGVTIEEEACL